MRALRLLGRVRAKGMWWFVVALMPISALAHGDLHPRIAALDRSIRDNPTNAALWRLRGELHRLNEEPALAIADFQRALELNPALDEAHLGLGRARLAAKQPTEARTAIESFLAKHPRDPEGRLIRARVLAALGERRQAAADYTEALSCTSVPVPDLYLERAGVLAAEGLLDEAIAGLDEGSQKLGRGAVLDLRALDLELESHRYDAALSRLNGMIERAPRKEFLLWRRGAILEQASRFAEARDAYGAAARELQTLPPERQATRAVRELGARVQTALGRLNLVSSGRRSLEPH